MLNVYFYLKDFSLLRKNCTIDLSLIPINNLANECDQILQHHQDCIVFLGYLEPGWMLDPKDEARIRRLIRKFKLFLKLQVGDSFSYKDTTCKFTTIINAIVLEKEKSFLIANHPYETEYVVTIENLIL